MTSGACHRGGPPSWQSDAAVLAAFTNTLASTTKYSYRVGLDRPRRGAGRKTRTAAGPSILIPASGAAGGKPCVKLAPLTSELVHHLQRRRHALIEKPIGEVAVG